MGADRTTVELRARIHAALGEPARLTVVDMLQLGDAAPGEIARALALPTNLVAHHLKVLEGIGLIQRARSEGDGRRSYVQLVPAVLELLRPPTLDAVPRVVFLCTHNSARSQLAAALWARKGDVPGASAGTEPARRIHRRTRSVAQRHGLKLSEKAPLHLSDVVQHGDLVVAVCDNAHEHLGEQIPNRLHWSVPDPSRVDTDAAFEAAYQDLANRVDRLASTLSQE